MHTSFSLRRPIWIRFSVACFLGATLVLARAAEPREISLSGEWKFALDPKKVGLKEMWFNKDLADTIALPGTTDEAKKGPLNTDQSQTNCLGRPYPYFGIAWYQKEVQIPESWKDQQIRLVLERTKNTTLWVDGTCFGEQNSLATPHIYNLSAALSPGPHRVTVAVDNVKLPPLSGHQINENTQTNWNGMLGQLALEARDKVWIERLQIFPDAANHRIKISAELGSECGNVAEGAVTFLVRPEGNAAAGQLAPQVVKFTHARGGDVVEATYDLGAKAKLWGEFSPSLYVLSAALQAEAGGQKYADRMERTFGLRDFSTQGTQFVINGHPTFLRGRVDCCVFPLTGYAPMDVAAWMRVFKTYQDYGLNYNRCHTYCPPEAAFEAADRLGIYIQPELPYIGPALGSDPAAQQFARDEGERILKTYGNHPSFVMFSNGNEIGKGTEARAAIVTRERSLDPTRLYTQASNYDYDNPHFAVGDDYWTTMRTKNGLDGNVRASFATVNGPPGHEQTGPPSTLMDYTKGIVDVPVPVIAHEIGTHEIFPDFSEMPRYTGVLKPWNMEVYRKRVEKAGLLPQSDAFMKASGALAVICYKEDVEASLRTKNFGGFDILDLLDFPGQGMSIDGILNALMESKGLVAPKDWREFCGPVVPLALMAKYAWTNDETFTALIKVANYGPTALPGPGVAWSLRDGAGHAVAVGELSPRKAPQGTLSELGTITTPLAKVASPTKFTFSIALKGTSYRNQYDIWVYPTKVDTTPPTGVTISRAWDADTIARLNAGRKVLLMPDLATLPNSVEGAPVGGYWCYPMFLRIAEKRKMTPAAGPLGLLCDPANPALAEFPTESHANWQWFPILQNSRSLILDQAPPALQPIVQVIDNAARNYKLALIFEATVGAGKLLVCTSDLPGHLDQPACRQLLASLLAYAGSDKFQPATPLTEKEADDLFKNEVTTPDKMNAARSVKDDRDAFPMLRK